MVMNVSHFSIVKNNISSMEVEIKAVYDGIVVKSYPIKDFSNVSIVRDKKPIKLLERVGYIDLRNEPKTTINSIKNLLVFL